MLALGLLLAATVRLAAQVPPDARWRTLETPHFRVNFVAGLDSLAHRTAARAEWAYDVLSRDLTDPPDGRIDIVLTDAVDLANGSATPFPTNRIVLYAHPPVDVTELAFTTDWLELLVLHELVHIFHLDQAEGLWEGLRSALGRNALLFPHAFTPSWLIEGLATYYESALTPAGRVRGTLFEMALRTAAVEDELFSIDRVSGQPRTWPAGSTRYIYGAHFLDHLARMAGGSTAMRDFIDRYGGQPVPYLLDRAADGAFGGNFRAAWRAWQDSLRKRFRAQADSVAAEGLTEPEILTPAGRDAYFPRFSPDGSRIAYSAAPGNDRPALRLILSDGTERDVAPLATLGPASWASDGDLLYGDVEFRDPYRLYSDLWTVSPAEFGRRRVTRGQRLASPDLHPDGRTVIAVRSGGGTTSLVVADTVGGAFHPLNAPSLDVQWGQPRWSPDGEWIAAVRWKRGGLHDIVLLDRSGTVVREVTRDQAVDASPAWSPDGRYLLFWSDRSGIPNLYAYELQADRLFQVTNVLSGAFDPDVSADGRWIAFSYYRADGYHIARIPFEPDRWRPAPPPRGAALPLEEPRSHPPVSGETRPYSPWPTVAPAAWNLALAGGTDLGGGIGAAVSGVDVIERHSWAAAALLYEGARMDAAGAYRYQGWGNPAIELAASQEWSVVCASGSLTCGGEEPLESALLRREREARLSLLWVRQRVRSTAWLRPALEIERRALLWKDPSSAPEVVLRQTPTDLAAVLEAGRSSVRSFALSVGPQEGYSVAAAVEGHRYTRPLQPEYEPAGYLRLVGRSRGYRAVRMGASTHVLALRADLGFEVGSRSPGFDVGGASGGSLPGAIDLEIFGDGASFPVRGYQEGVQFGNRAVTTSAEYRFPLLRVERGIGLLPVYLDRFTGDVFVDAGTAWCSASCPTRLAAAPDEPRVLASVGGEVVTELRFGFHTPVPLRLGLAVPLREDLAPEVYLRVGRAF